MEQILAQHGRKGGPTAFWLLGRSGGVPGHQSGSKRSPQGSKMDPNGVEMDPGGPNMVPKGARLRFGCPGVPEAPLDVRSEFLGRLDETVPDVCARCSSRGGRWLASGVGMQGLPGPPFGFLWARGRSPGPARRAPRNVRDTKGHRTVENCFLLVLPVPQNLLLHAGAAESVPGPPVPKVFVSPGWFRWSVLQ